MELRKLTEDVSVSPQITPEEVAAIKAAGFQSIVCHRPNGEAADQALYEDVENAAKAAGVEIRFQPVVSGQMTDDDAVVFAKLMEELPKPLLAYCRTGTRCTALWSLASASSLSVPEILAKAAAVGYDMSGLAHRIETLKSSG